MDMWHIQDIHGKGRGIVARKHIPIGKRILAEKPLFTLSNEKTVLEQTEDIEKAIAALDADQHRAFFQLSNCRSDSPNSNVSIVRTNLTELDDTKCGIFLKWSYLNHSCRPNAHQEWNNESGYMTVHTLRAIDPGEEICISYFSGFSMPYAKRQEHLRTGFCFTCTCEACSLPASQRAVSDRRLQRVWEIAHSGDSARNLENVFERPARAFGQLREMTRILRDESGGADDGRVAWAYMHAFAVAAIVGDEARSRVLAMRYSSLQELLAGDDHPEAIRFKDLSQCPMGSELFGLQTCCVEKSGRPPLQVEGVGFESWLWDTTQWMEDGLRN